MIESATACYLTFLIDHPDIDPEQISQSLALAPTLIQKNGEPTPAGGKQVYGWSKWQLVNSLDAQAELAPQLETFVDLIQERESGIQLLVAKGCNLQLFLRASDFSHIQCMVSPSTLGMLARLNIAYGFEVIA